MIDHTYLGKSIYCAVKGNLKTWEPSTTKNIFCRNLLIQEQGTKLGKQGLSNKW